MTKILRIEVEDTETKSLQSVAKINLDIDKLLINCCECGKGINVGDFICWTGGQSFLCGECVIAKVRK